MLLATDKSELFLYEADKLVLNLSRVYFNHHLSDLDVFLKDVDIEIDSLIVLIESGALDTSPTNISVPVLYFGVDIEVE